jgi:nucleoside-diphosphate-sugar epimerase
MPERASFGSVAQMILITGGNGFIGSHIVHGLTAAGHRVRTADIEPNPRQTGAEVVAVDVRNLDALRRATAGCTGIIHQAALVSVPESVADPLRCHEINATGTLNVLLAAREAAVQRVVVASSSAIYGNDPIVPKRESMLPAPVSPYAASKLAAEDLCRVFYQSYGLETVALRYFNVYGPGQPAASPYAAVIPKFIETLVAGRTPVIYGDGNQTRDFVFVQDVVQANIRATQASGVGGMALNIGSGAQTSLNQLLEIISAMLGVTPRVEYRPEREGDVRHSVADISLARELLGFQPSTSLESGLRQTIDWFLQNTARENASPASA